MALTPAEAASITLLLPVGASIFDPRSNLWYDRNASQIPAPLIIASGYCEFKWVATGPTTFTWVEVTKCSSNPAKPCHWPVGITSMPSGLIVRIPC